MSSSETIRADFAKRFGREARVSRAPGRVNLIGEHTDYNEGYVLPAAIGLDVRVAYAKGETSALRVQSIQEASTSSLNLAAAHARPCHNWTDYIQGVEVQFQRMGYVPPGADLLVDGKVPMGGGLSSSAALEVAVAFALQDMGSFKLDQVQIAKLCQRAENEFVGARCGIMDQFSSVFGRGGHALLLDCRTLEVRYVAIPAHVSLVVCNTMVKHSLSGGEYNKRRNECEEGLRYFAKRIPDARALRDVTEGDMTKYGADLPDVLLRRCRHVVTENARVLRAADALETGDLEALGKLMHDSHVSLRDDYEVSCPELDIMVDIAINLPGIYGARMTGGGFGGCTINLVEKELVNEFQLQISKRYKESTNIDPEIHVTWAADGAAIEI